MINIKKVVGQIKNDILYNTLLFEITEALDDQDPDLHEIENLLQKHPHYIAEYKEINRFSEISSIQVKDLVPQPGDPAVCKKLKLEINKNIKRLKELENFETDSSGSAYSIWIGSVGVMVIFMLHNYFALFTELYTSHGNYLYVLFALITAGTYWSYRRMKQNHEVQHQRFLVIYQKTKALIAKGLDTKFFGDEELYV